MNTAKKSALALAAVAMLCGCSHNQWKVDGTLANAPEDATLVVEAPNFAGGWYPIDTVTVGKSGKFTVKGKPFGYPEILRLNLNGKMLYFPVDSVETVTISADANLFDTHAQVSGSESADKLQRVNNLLDSIVAIHGEGAVAYDPDLKRKLSEMILRDPAGVVSYYTIFRRVGNTPVFDPKEKSDLKMIGAVANAFAMLREGDPRSAFLERYFVSNRRAITPLSGLPDTLMVSEIKLPEIELFDKVGTRRSLTAEAAKGKVIILNFTAYSAPESPAFNLELAKVYDAHKAQGLEIYQVSIDDDEFAWKQSAKNLPWITVYNTPKDGAKTLIDYNVTTLPTTFIINRNGELVERVEQINRLEASVGRYL